MKKKPCTMLPSCKATVHRSKSCPAYGRPIKKKKRDGLDGLRGLLP